MSIMDQNSVGRLKMVDGLKFSKRLCMKGNASAHNPSPKSIKTYENGIKKPCGCNMGDKECKHPQGPLVEVKH